MIKTAETAELESGMTALSAGEATCDVRHASPEVVGAVRRELVSDRTAEVLAATFSVLGDPTRVRLLDALAVQELCVCELASLVDSSESAVSHQLRLLRSLRLVRSRRSGRMVFYRLDDDHIRRLLDQGRRHIEEQTAPERRREPHPAPRTASSRGSAPSPPAGGEGWGEGSPTEAAS